MRAGDVYTVHLSDPPRGSKWRRFLAAVFRTLGDYPDTQKSHILVAERATGRVIASIDSDPTAFADAEADLARLTDEEFVRRWLPSAP